MMLTKEFFDILMRLEGVYSNDPMDKGGATIYGIASKYHPEDFNEVYELYKNGSTDDALKKAMQFYNDKFYIPIRANKIEPISKRIAYCYFDSAVNSGRGTAIRQLQYAINMILELKSDKNPIKKQIACDGIYGNETDTALNFVLKQIEDNKELEFKMFSQMLASRIFYYTSRKSQYYLRGWMNRLARMLRSLNKIC